MSLCAQIVAEGGRAAVVTCDLADHDQVATLMSAARAAVGPLTLLVNNAAEFEPDEIGHLDRARFDRHFAVNLRAPLFLAEAFAAQAPAGLDASIVNLIDQRVYRPTPRFLSYGLTKSALHAATDDPGAGIGAAHPGQCRRAGPDAAERAGRMPRLSRGNRRPSRSAAVPRPRRSPRPWSISRRRAA